MMHSPRRAVPLVVILAALAGVAGCSSDQPDMCESVAALESSVGHLKNVQLGENGLAEARTYLTHIKADIKGVQTTAAQQYGSEVDAVTDAVDDVDEILRVTKEVPSAKTLGPLADAVAAVASKLAALHQAVSGSC